MTKLQALEKRVAALEDSIAKLMELLAAPDEEPTLEEQHQAWVARGFTDVLRTR